MLDRRQTRRTLTASVVALGLVASAASTVLAAEDPIPVPSSQQVQAQERPAAAHHPIYAITLKKGRRAEASSVGDEAKRHGGKQRKVIDALHLVTVEVPRATSAAFEAKAKAHGAVERVELLPDRRFSFTPNDPQFSQQSAYLTSVAAPAAWDLRRGPSPVKVAMIDSGLDTAHPDLQGRVAATYNPVNGSTDVTDVIGHGTWTTGVAAATTNNGVGIAGASFGAQVLAVKVDDGNGNVSSDGVIKGIVWAADQGAKVINLSLGGPSTTQAEANAVAYAVNKGAVVVAAAGNDSTSALTYPAAYPNVIAVGATDGKGQRARFSNYGSWVDVGAPGVGIRATDSSASPVVTEQYATVDGTSFSAPLVAGEAALILAARPTLTASQVGTIITKTAHGYAGQGLGTGQVDFRRALEWATVPLTKPTITAPAAGSTVSGAVVLKASSTAAKVQFMVRGVKVGGPVAVSSGTARTSWASWGAANGALAVTAVDCTAHNICSSSPSSVSVTLTNAAPVVTWPTSGKVMTGQSSFTASAPGGGVAFEVDGVRRGFDGTSPYALSHAVSGLTDGSHSVVAVGCSASGSVCSGPKSAAVSFTVKALHPKITKIAPVTFSPNGDALGATTTATYYLPDYEDVTWVVRNSSGTVVRGPIPYGYQTAGTRGFTWNGRTNTGAYAPHGVYRLELYTKKQLSTGWLYGSAAGSVWVDLVKPTLSGVTGNGARFFPAADGYLDTFRSSMRLSESATVFMTVRNSSGGVVRSFGVWRAPGAVTVDWNGRTNSNTWAPSGTYTWQLVAQDPAGNRTASPVMTLALDWRKMVSKFAQYTQRGSSYVFGGGTMNCAWVSLTSSDYKPNGLHLVNNCGSQPTHQDSFAQYVFTVPAAYSYTGVKVETYGRSHFAPSSLGVLLHDFSNDTWFAPAPITASATTAWRTVANVGAAGLVSASRQAEIDLYVPNDYTDLSDFDLSYVRFSIGYKVLQ